MLDAHVARVFTTVLLKVSNWLLDVLTASARQEGCFELRHRCCSSAVSGLRSGCRLVLTKVTTVTSITTRRTGSPGMTEIYRTDCGFLPIESGPAAPAVSHPRDPRAGAHRERAR